jgi:hypothetical protein
MLNRRLIVSCAVAALSLAAAPQARAERSPRMVAALGEMKEARVELKEAKHDFGGHRAEALRALDEAVVQMDRALRAVGVDPAFVPPGRDVYRGYKNCPHIRHALNELRGARVELKDAPHDFKGHRAAALAAVDAAIVQLERALEFAR